MKINQEDAWRAFHKYKRNIYIYIERQKRTGNHTEEYKSSFTEVSLGTKI